MDLNLQKSSYSALIFLAIICCISVPQWAFASSVAITEVMYDARGSDAGHEWIELTNLGDTSVSVSSYKLFESTMTHGLSVMTGDANMGPGMSAILTTDPMAFSASFPNYTGVILKASFTLANDGETIVLKNASSTPLDTFTYTSSMGGHGDGESLHKIGLDVKAGVPDPGVYTLSVSRLKPIPILQKNNSVGFVQKVPQLLVSTYSHHTTASSSGASHVSSNTKGVRSFESPLPPIHRVSPLYIEGILGLMTLVALALASVWYAESAAQLIEKETMFVPEEFEIESD